MCWKTFMWKKCVKYCSQECINKSVQDKLGKDWICLNCWKPIRWINGKKFCDRKCRDKYKYHKELKICECCWKEFMWSSITKYCSVECRTKCRSENFKQANLEKYWVEYPQQNKAVREKGKQTCIEKYWVENVAQNKEIQQKIEGTNIEKYWVKNPLQNKEIHKKATEKSIITNLERYWVPYYCMTEDCWNAWNTISKVNIKFDEYLNWIWFKTEKEFVIWNKAYDIKVWEILIELNPYPYHNTTWSPKRTPVSEDYHYNKLKLARDNWYRCIMVWDWDDWDKISYLLEENKEWIYARKCEVKQIEYNEAHDFFEKYHLQWDTKKDKNNIYIWLYYNNELVECMSFWKPRYNSKYEWEILRLCSHKDYKVMWWANKIFKHFLKLTNTDSIISYCDMSKFDWKVYEQLWFKLLKWNTPSKHWYSPKWENKHITDNLLRQRWYDQLFWANYWKWTSNEELMKQNGYVEIYDCWQATFVRNK